MQTNIHVSTVTLYIADSIKIQDPQPSQSRNQSELDTGPIIIHHYIQLVCEKHRRGNLLF